MNAAVVQTGSSVPSAGEQTGLPGPDSPDTKSAPKGAQGAESPGKSRESQAGASTSDGIYKENVSVSTGERSRLPDSQPHFDDSLLNPKLLGQEIALAHAHIESHRVVIVRGPACVDDFTNLVIRHWKAAPPAVCGIGADSQFHQRPLAHFLECLEGRRLDGEVLRLDFRQDEGALLHGLWSDKGFERLVGKVKEAGGVVVIALRQARYRLPPALASLDSVECQARVPWLRILTQHWARKCDCEEEQLTAICDEITARLRMDPSREPMFADRLSGISLLPGTGPLPLSRRVQAILSQEADDSMLTTVMEQGWRRGMHRTLLGMYALLPDPAYATFRELGAELARGDAVRVPVEKEESIERNGTTSIVRSSMTFESRDAGEEWTSHLDAMLRACGLTGATTSDQRRVVTCTGLNDWTETLLRDGVRARYPGAVCHIVEQTLKKNLLFPFSTERQQIARDSAQLLVAACTMAARDYPVATMLNQVMVNALELVWALERQHAEDDAERPSWNLIAFGLACFLYQLQESVRPPDEPSSDELITGLLDKTLGSRHYTPTRLLTLAFGWIVREGRADAETHLIFILERSDIFSEEHVRQLWETVHQSLRMAMRRSLQDRCRILRDLANRPATARREEPLRNELLAELWHDAFRQDFATQPVNPIDKSFASLLKGGQPELESMLALLFSSPLRTFLFQDSETRIWSDTAQVLLSSVAASTVVDSLKASELVDHLARIVCAAWKQKSEAALLNARRETETTLEKAAEELLRRNASEGEIERTAGKVGDTRAVREYGEAFYSPVWQYRCLAVAVWPDRAAQSSARDADAGLASLDKTLAQALARVLNRQQCKQLNLTWREAVTWLTELESGLQPLSTSTAEARKEYDRVRKCVAQTRAQIRALCDQLRDAAGAGISATE